MRDLDQTEALAEQVQQAVTEQQPIDITGSGTKHFLGQPVAANKNEQHHRLNTTDHVGVVSYEPTELVVTVRTGTPLKELNNLLSDNGQMLPFEPPVLGAGTVGGVLACGLSGPARPFAGAVRDYVLGMRVINGQAQTLRFGGEVMKNVAGYDAARLHVGAYGTLGVLLETSMKVLPKPAATMTVRLEHENELDTGLLQPLLRRPLPISAAAIIGREHVVRLSGSEAAVNAAAKMIGGDADSDGDAFWTELREFRHSFFSDNRTLWRISVPDFSTKLSLSGDWLYDWGGAQRFLFSDVPASEIYSAVAAARGHATCFTPDKLAPGTPVFQPIEGAMASLQTRVRDSFDSHRLFNRGRFHPELDLAAAAADNRAVVDEN